MSESLIKLRNCCGQLASDKVTERKKQVEIFKQQLSRQSVCRQLDENSENGRGMTWEHCFETVREFMQKEVDHVRNRLSSGKGNPDHRKLLSTPSLLKWFVQKANSRGEHLNLTNLVDHITFLIRDDEGLLCYGTECCMVVREVLFSWKYRCRLTSKSWQEFLKYFCKCLLTPPARLSLDLLGTLVHQLFTGAIHHGTIRKGIFFSFFKQVVEKCRSELSGTMINTVLGSLNVFCTHAAADCRGQVCRLGGDSILTLLQVWKNQHSSTKEAVVEFLHLQMRVHHPKGALTEVDGALAINMDHWKSLVQRMYEVLYVEWSQASQKLKLKGTGGKEVKFSPSLVKLSADVCRQVFAGSQEVVVVDGFEPFSQSGTPKRKNASGQLPTKRRKQETGWKMLRDHMTQAGQSQSIIPWLQLTEALLQNYPASLPQEEIPEFLAVFVQLQSDCKRGEILAQLLLALEALVVCQHQQQDLLLSTNQGSGSSLAPSRGLATEWNKVWAATIRTIGLRTSEAEGFTLLRSLLLHKLVTPGQEIWKLFTSSIIHPTESSVGFLSVLLQRAHLPERHSIELGPSSQTDHPLREDLMEWLFSTLEASDNNARVSSTSSMSHIPSTALAMVITSLICKSPQSILECGYSSCESSNQETSNIDQIEELFLASSFDKSSVQRDKLAREGSPKDSVPSVLPEMLNYLMKKVTEACTSHQLVDFSEYSMIPDAIQYAAVVVKVTAIIVTNDVLPLDHASVTQTMRSIQSLLERIAENIKTALSNVDDSSKDDLLLTLHPAIRELADMYQWSTSSSACLSENGIKAFSDVIRLSTSASLLDLLMSFVVTKGLKKREHPSASSVSRSNCPMDDFDDEFDSVPSVRDGPDSEEDEFAVQQCSIDPLEAVNGANKHAGYSTSDQFLLTACSVLALYCNSLRCGQGMGSERSSKHDLIKKLLQSFNEEKWQPKPPSATLEMVFVAMNTILQSGDQIADSQLVFILRILRSIASTYRRDQDTCVKILTSIELLIPRMAMESGRTSMDLLSARESLLLLLAGFWTLQKEGYYIAEVRLSFARCLHALLEVDPESKWATLKAKEKGQGDGDDQTKIRDVLAEQLTDASHLVRVHVAKNIQSFFHGPGSEVLSKEAQNMTFDLLYQTLQSGMTLKGKMSVSEQSDEASNRTATLLVGLSSIAQQSPASLKKVVFALIQAIKLNGLEIHTVQKVLNQIWRHWAFRDSLSFMEAHLGYLIDQWLQLDYNLGEFPYQLLNCESMEQFYRNYHPVLVPYLVLASKTDAIEAIATHLGDDRAELIKASFSRTMAFLLPPLVNDDPLHEDQKQMATICLDTLNSVLSKKILETLIQSNLANIVVELLTRLFEPYTVDSKLSSYLRPTDPEPNTPHFTSTNLLDTFEYLTRCHSNSGSLTLVLLLSKSQDGLQLILYSLHAHVAKSHTTEDKHRGLMAYHLFVKLILKDLESGLGNSWMFVLRTVINMLVQTIRELLAQAREACGKGSVLDRCLILCVDTLHAVCESCLKPCSEELCCYLQIVIKALVSLLDTAAKHQSLKLINLLIVESSVLLSDALKDIDPLPDIPQLQTAKDSLMAIKMRDGDINLLDEMSMFLMKDKIHSEGGLRNLRRLVAERKDELAVLIGQCKEEGSDSLVPRVLCMLIKLCTESHDQRIQQEAAACLGEIGAPNMSLVALQSVSLQDSLCYSTAVTDYSQNGDSLGCRNAILIHLLNQHLVQKDVDTIHAAATCLKNVFSTPTGQAFYDEYRSKNIDKLLKYLHPFKPNKKKYFKIPDSIMPEEDITSNLDSLSLWQPSVGTTHDVWVTKLTVGLIRSGAVKDEILKLMGPVCSVKAAFAESILPYLIHDILLSGDGGRSEVIGRRLSGVLTSVCEGKAPSSGHGINSINLDPKVGQKCVKTLLAVVHYLRTQEKPTGGRQKGTPWDNNFWLDIDYLLLAMGAQLCQAQFTCLLYTEIWYNTVRDQNNDIGDSSQQSLDALAADADINVQKLLLEAHSSIGEPDGLYGCGVSRMTDDLARIHTYEHEGDWTRVVAGYDLIGSGPGAPSSAGLLQALQNAGLSHVLQMYLKGSKVTTSREDDPGLLEAQYEAAWRNGIWEITDQTRSDFSGFHNCIYNSLLAVCDRDHGSGVEALRRGRSFVLDQLHHASLESIHSVYPLLSRLQVLKELEEIQSVAFGQQDLDALLTKWVDHHHLIDTSFDFSEMTFSLRLSGLRALSDRCPETSKTAVNRGISKQLLLYSKAATRAQRFQVAERSLCALKEVGGALQSEGPGTAQWSRCLQEAEMFWAKSETSTALYLVKALIDQLSTFSAQHETYKQVYPEALTLYGKWLAESRTESPHVIIENYLEKAVDVCEVASSPRTTSMTSYLTLARFADAQYQHVINYMKSPEFESKKGILTKYRTDVEQLAAMGDNKTRYFRNLLKQGDLDESEMESLLQDRSQYLNTSLECYLKYLMTSSDLLDIPVFRLCSLWFSNVSDQGVNNLIKEYVKKLPSSKFLPMLYQLAARMTTKTQDKEAFHTTLQQLIEKTAQDHPYHTLPIILALANANKDVTMTVHGKKGGRLSRNALASDASHADQDRMEAAVLMVKKLRSGRTAAIMRDMEKLSEAYIELAYWDVTQYKKVTKPISFPPNLQICGLRDIKTAVATIDIPVDASCSYDNVVTIRKFEPTFKLAGGINLPKIIMCTGSDGVKRRQLVKGKDDLRQDAVMQQVFGLVNNLLAANPETSQRQLHIRRYKVVPLSQRSGILEWCEGTMPLGLYLLGDQKTDCGAHKRYRPQDKTSLQCRKVMEAHTSEGDSRYRTYTKVCKHHFKPVFRHFFFEKFLEPALWFERRLAYTRSAATCSIVGYVVGLGDRHVQNILIDCNTAELVHIDLGVAFEQGRILPTPETVPFRLTRDLVDGMGVAGVEGVFRRCCEKTVEVMRNNQEALLAVLEVLLYDPLYDWSMSPRKALALQKQQDRLEGDGDTSGTAPPGASISLLVDQLDSRPRYQAEQNSEINVVAERALLRLQHKLQGLEEGVALSVSGQVNHLIQEAMDPKNLCRVFPGWQPWV